jgi:hypothetical protein
MQTLAFNIASVLHIDGHRAGLSTVKCGSRVSAVPTTYLSRRFATSIYLHQFSTLNSAMFDNQLSDMTVTSQPRVLSGVTPVRLHNLIPELLLNVATFLSQTDLLTLTLTNKHLKEVTEPELFKEFVNRESYGSSSIRRFVLTLLDRPHLAKCVHRVHLGSYYHLQHVGPSAYYLDEFLDCEENEYQRLCEAAVDAGVIGDILPFKSTSSVREFFSSFDPNATDPPWGYELGTDWYTYIYDGTIRIEDIPYDAQFCELLHLGLDEPFVVLLLAILPDVREIDIWGVPNHRYSLQWRAKHRFQTLKHLKASGCDDAGQWPLPLFHNVLQGKNLRNLQVHGMGTERAINWTEDGIFSRVISLSPRSTNITHLVLEHCNLESADMETILQACAPLRSLSFSTLRADNVTVDYTVQEMVNMLNSHKHSLEYLSLYMDIEWYIDESIISSPSFHDFAVLKKLDTNAIIWADLLHNPQAGPANLLSCTNIDMVDLLPPSIEQIIIQEARNYIPNKDWDYGQLNSVILQRNERLPKLRDIVLVHIDEQMSEAHYEMFSTMVVRAVQRGFCFSFAARSQYRKAYPTLFASAGDQSLYPIFGHPPEVRLGSIRQE